MNEAIDDRFVEIIEHAMDEAAKVPCSLPEFYLGLRIMRAVVDAHLEAEVGLQGELVGTRTPDPFA